MLACVENRTRSYYISVIFDPPLMSFFLLDTSTLTTQKSENRSEEIEDHSELFASLSALGEELSNRTTEFYSALESNQSGEDRAFVAKRAQLMNAFAFEVHFVFSAFLFLFCLIPSVLARFMSKKNRINF